MSTKPPAPPRHTDLGLGISMSVLPNGLRVVLVHDERAPEVSLTMRYRVGAIDDGAHPGIAHMAEHLMYQQNVGNESLFAQLEESTTYFNGGTTYDSTTYISRAPRPELDHLLMIEGMRMQLRCTTITDAVFERERAVVINEIRQRDDSTQLRSAIHASVYPAGHPYRQSVGGSEESLAAMKREDVCAFVDAHYAPENAVLVVSGNLTPDELATSLRKLIAHVPRRPVAPPGYVPSVPSTATRGDAPAPLDDEALLVTWPMPVDPRLRTQVRAIAAALPTLLNYQIKGSVTAVELGDEGARVFGIVAVAGPDESLWSVKEKVASTITDLSDVFDPKWRVSELDQIGFDNIRQSAIYRLYVSLELPDVRDQMLAGFVLAGRDPSAALSAEFEGLRDLTPSAARELVERYLSNQTASVITLKPEPGKKRGHNVALSTDIHDMGQRRSVPDPAAARKPATVAVPNVTGMATKQLDNGLHVVLLPLNSVPTIDVRLVFGSGTADDPADKRGVAQLAARALGWNIRYVNDLLAFAAAGGTNHVEVTPDHTSFSTEGVDMHVDYLLAGLRRWVRDGTYQRGTEGLVEAMRAAAKEEVDVNTAVADAWNAALYGPGHPYTATGLRHMAGTLGDEDAEQFRRAHYTPDNATLVISGRFDPALAQQWIEYLFADWSGHAVTKTLPQATLSPASIGLVDDIQQAQLRIALPATTTNRAAKLVIAQMLADIAADIRHQLGASYGVRAILGEERLATEYVVAGWVDQSRARETAEFLAKRIADLHGDPDAAARAFVLARNRVLVRMGSLTASAEALGQWVEHDIDLQRGPLSDLALADQVRTLTIDQLASELTELDLERAVVLVRGPEEPLKQVFEALHRAPSLVQFDQAKQDSIADDPLESKKPEAPPRRRQQEEISYLEPALTEDAPRSRWTIQVLPAYARASYVDPQSDQLEINCCKGGGIAANVGFAYDRAKTVGFRFAIASLRGSRQYLGSFFPGEFAIELLPIDLGFFARFETWKVWASVGLGLHVDRLYREHLDLSMPSEVDWSKSIGIGVQAGLDLLRFGRHTMGVGGEIDGAPGATSGYGAFMLGLVYRIGL